MRRLVVLAVLLLAAAWWVREARWLALPAPLAPNAHDAYRDTLARSGALDTPLGRRWLAASRTALDAAEPVTTLPARRTLSVAASDPEAWAFRLALKRGQRAEVVASFASASPGQAFVDVFAPGVTNDGEAGHERGAMRGVDFEADDDREVIVRVQPELLRTGQLTVRLRAAPALRFPVANASPRALQSVFGDPRDAGRRQHEGVDIFATRGTPVLSATDGVVVRVGETGLGGRVVWVWDIGRGLRLYYAHLEEQGVTTGQRVSAGDVIGTVGNSGNARTTAPHLHFGIYERGSGAIDPYWFIAPYRSSGARAIS